MAQQVLARVAVVGLVLVGVVALCGPRAQELTKKAGPLEEIECTGTDHRLAEQLARDSVLTSPPPGATLDRIEQFPCGGESDRWGRVTADIGLPPGTLIGPVLDYYRTLLTAGGWRISPEPGDTNLFCADRLINGQQVRLLLGYGRAMPGPHTYGELGIEISFPPGGEDLRCYR